MLTSKNYALPICFTFKMNIKKEKCLAVLIMEFSAFEESIAIEFAVDIFVDKCIPESKITTDRNGKPSGHFFDIERIHTDTIYVRVYNGRLSLITRTRCRKRSCFRTFIIDERTTCDTLVPS